VEEWGVGSPGTEGRIFWEDRGVEKSEGRESSAGSVADMRSASEATSALVQQGLRDYGRRSLKGRMWRIRAERVEDGRWKVENGRWKVDNGQWKVEGGMWKPDRGRWKVLGGGRRWESKVRRWAGEKMRRGEGEEVRGWGGEEVRVCAPSRGVETRGWCGRPNLVRGSSEVSLRWCKVRRWNGML
jgi:hypothetical protein